MPLIMVSITLMSPPIMAMVLLNSVQVKHYFLIVIRLSYLQKQGAMEKIISIFLLLVSKSLQKTVYVALIEIILILFFVMILNLLINLLLQKRPFQHSSNLNMKANFVIQAFRAILQTYCCLYLLHLMLISFYPMIITISLINRQILTYQNLEQTLLLL